MAKVLPDAPKVMLIERIKQKRDNSKKKSEAEKKKTVTKFVKSKKMLENCSDAKKMKKLSAELKNHIT